MTTDNRSPERASNLPPARQRRRSTIAVGRANSARNATRHGVLSQEFIGPNESMDAFNALLNQLVTEYEPQAATEFVLVQRLAMLFWRERRLAKSEAGFIARNALDIEPGLGSPPYPIEHQLLVGRYQTMLGNQISKTIEQLKSFAEARNVE